ncbi:hypothetical protein [Streptosporangium sp. NPDC000396]
MRVTLLVACFNDTFFPKSAGPSSPCSNGSGTLDVIITAEES